MPLPFLLFVALFVSCVVSLQPQKQEQSNTGNVLFTALLDERFLTELEIT